MKTICLPRDARLVPGGSVVGARMYCMRRVHRQRGVTLVEWMVSLTVGLILVAGLLLLFSQQSTTQNELEKSSRQVENGRYALQLLKTDLELAGYWGEYTVPADASRAVPADPCDMAVAAQGWNAASSPVTVPVAVQGYAGDAATPSCVSNRKSGTPMLVLRRVEVGTTAVASAVAGTAYLQVSRCSTDLSRFVFGTGGFAMKAKDCSTNVAPLHKYLTRIYYVSTCSVCGKDTLPTLKMVEFFEGAQNIKPLVEGIENMQFDYGVDTTGDGSPDAYATAPAAADWRNVMAVRVHLLARNNDMTGDYQDTKTYSLGLAGSVTPSGADAKYKRHVFSQLVRLTNESARRDQ